MYTNFCFLYLYPNYYLSLLTLLLCLIYTRDVNEQPDEHKKRCAKAREELKRPAPTTPTLEDALSELATLRQSFAEERLAKENALSALGICIGDLYDGLEKHTKRRAIMQFDSQCDTDPIRKPTKQAFASAVVNGLKQRILTSENKPEGCDFPPPVVGMGPREHILFK